MELESSFTEDRNARLMRAALDICLLALIFEKERYGYELVRDLGKEDLKLVKEGTVYPLLRRMEKGGLIKAHLVVSEDGPARKYYQILPRGRELLLAWGSEFVQFVDTAKNILERRVDFEQHRTS